MKVKFLLITFISLVSFVCSESTPSENTNECQNFRDFMDRIGLNIGEKSFLECNEDGKLLNL